MNFGEAIELLKKGKAVTRPGWNGKGMFLMLDNPNCGGSPALLRLQALRVPAAPLQPSIWMWTADLKWQPGWLASQADVLAEDWLEWDL